MKTRPETTECPSWCERADGEREHYGAVNYVAATRSLPIWVDASGGHVPAVGAGVHQYGRDGVEISLHIAASGGLDVEGVDLQCDFRLDEAIDLAGNFLKVIADALEGEPSGVLADRVLPIREHAERILAAHGLTEATS